MKKWVLAVLITLICATGLYAGSSWMNELSEETAPASTDIMVVSSPSNVAAQKMTLANLLTLIDTYSELNTLVSDVTLVHTGIDDDTPDNDSEVPNAITVTAQAGSTWNVADSVTIGSVYSGTTSLEETTAANDSGAYLVGVYDEFAVTCANVQDCLDELDAAIAALGGFGASIDDTEMTAEDFGDFTNAGGEDGFTLDADVVGVDEIADADFGDLSCSAGVCSLDADVIAAAEMADADFGDWACSGGSCTLDADVVAAAEMADADFGDWACSGGSCTLDADVVAAAEMADADHGDVAWSSGVATVQAVSGTNAVDSDAYVDGSIDPAHLADADFGEFTCASGTCSLDADVVGVDEIADADFGDYSCSAGVCSLDADVVAAAEMADADFGDWACSGGSCTLDADVVAAAEMADADHGDVAWSSGVATVQTVSGTNAVDSDAYVDGSIDPAHLADADFGEFTCASGTCSLDADVVGVNEIADADFGDWACSGGSCTLDADVVSTNEMADADFGDWSCSGGSCTLDADTVAAAEMADADHGDVAWSGGVATVEEVTITDDESNDDAHELVFTTDNAALESDGDLTYNPSSGTLAATAFSGSTVTASGAVKGLNSWGANITENSALNTTALHGVIYQVTAACTITLDAAADAGYGAAVMFWIRDASETVIIEIDASDKINLHGTPLDAGDTIDSPGNAGDFIVLIATTDADGSGTDGWITLGYGEAVWTDGGAT